MCGCAGGGFGAGGGGGGTGNISGNLTAPFIPVATALHALENSGAEWDGGLSRFRIVAIDLVIDPDSLTYGANFSVDHDAGDTVVGGTLAVAGLANLNGGIAVDTNKFTVADATGDTVVGGTLAVAGLANLNGGIAVDTNKFTVADATGDMVAGGTSDLKGQVTIEKSTILGIGTLANVAGAVDINADDSDFFEFDWTTDATINEPTNPRNGRRFMLRIRTIGTAGHTLTWNPIFIFIGLTPPVIDETLSGYWYLGFVYNEHNNRWHAAGQLSGIFSSV